MAELLGLGITDFPFLRTSGSMAGVLKMALARGEHMKPEMKDPANWPAPMRAEWGEDEGLTASGPARERQVQNLKRIKAALDDFGPDFIIIWSKDHMESLKQFALPPYWIQAHDRVQTKPFSGGAPNVFGEDPERVVTIEGHPQGAKYLIRGLQQAGLAPAYSLEALHPNGLTHTFQGGVVYLDWERREFQTPVVPFPIDPFGPRERLPEGMAPLQPDHLYPIPASRAFELGAATARILRASPWRVALVAATGWSHTQNTSWERGWVHPQMEGDRRRYEEWASNKFDTWHNFTYEELEEYGQWEHLCWIALAGAMTEAGAKVIFSDYQENWCFNSNWVNTIFSVA